MDLQPATIINNRYEIHGEIGSGAMSKVYRGKSLLLEREVAIKVLNRSGSQDIIRFQQEAKLLGHYRCSKVQETGTQDERACSLVVCRRQP